jgi:hypothetical protein
MQSFLKIGPLLQRHLLKKYPPNSIQRKLLNCVGSTEISWNIGDGRADYLMAVKMLGGACSL